MGYKERKDHLTGSSRGVITSDDFQTLPPCSQHSFSNHLLSTYEVIQEIKGFPLWLSGKESACNTGDTGDVGSVPGSGKIPWRRAWQPTPVFLPGESHGQRSLAGCPSTVALYEEMCGFFFFFNLLFVFLFF